MRNTSGKPMLDIEGHQTYISVATSYFDLLQSICFKILENIQNKEINKRKYLAIKRELFDFLVIHKKYFNFKKCEVMKKYENLPVETLMIDYSGNYDEFLKLDDCLKYVEKCIELYNTEVFQSVVYCIDRSKNEMIKTIKNRLQKQDINNEDLKTFFETSYLVDEYHISKTFTNYNELSCYIDKRRNNYWNSRVSIERINEMSFKFQGSIKDFEDEKSCGVCLQDYEKDQEVCRLPCNHFCCRNCTEKMFAIPQDGSKAHFQCPFCRGDCT